MQDMESMFIKEGFGADDSIVNLAAQAGVRYAQQNPEVPPKRWTCS
jgi:hypothetical protein